MASHSHPVIALQVTCSGSVIVSSELVLTTLSAACEQWVIAFSLYVLPLETYSLLASHAFQVCILL